MSCTKWFAFTVSLLTVCQVTQAEIIAPTEDVMTSSFFQGTNTVRGYVGDNRPTFRVSTDAPFATPGAETIYLRFDPTAFAAYTTPVASAVLTMTAVAGGFSADASAATPFLVSAHGVSSDPFTSIADDTNAGGTTDWLSFYNNNILTAAPAAMTSVNGLGQFQFNVTSLVNDWISGNNTVFSIALTGKNDTSGNDFLQGFRNNSDTSSNQGFSFLSVTAVPEPSSMFALAAGSVGAWVVRVRNKKVKGDIALHA